MDIGQATADPAAIASSLLDFSRQNKMPLEVRWHCAVLLFSVGACASEVVQKTDLSSAQVPTTRMPQGDDQGSQG